MINHSGRLPQSYEELVTLPGVGEYTAKAIRVFAFNEPEIMIETNIRTAFIHHFFRESKEKIPDQEILSYMIRFGIHGHTTPREWYAALMDYGAYLKKTHPNPSRKSTHYAKQKTFKGSDREIRGAILRILATGPMSRRRLDMGPFEKQRIGKQLNVLVREGLVAYKNSLYQLP